MDNQSFIIIEVTFLNHKYIVNHKYIIRSVNLLSERLIIEVKLNTSITHNNPQGFLPVSLFWYD